MIKRFRKIKIAVLAVIIKDESNVVFKVQFFCADSESGIRFALCSLFWREIDPLVWSTSPL